MSLHYSNLPNCLIFFQFNKGIAIIKSLKKAAMLIFHRISSNSISNSGHDCITDRINISKSTNSFDGYEQICFVSIKSGAFFTFGTNSLSMLIIYHLLKAYNNSPPLIHFQAKPSPNNTLNHSFSIL